MEDKKKVTLKDIYITYQDANYENNITELTEDLESDLLDAIEQNDPDYKELAKTIASIIKNDYGSHNIKPFLRTLKMSLNESRNFDCNLLADELQRLQDLNFSKRLNDAIDEVLDLLDTDCH